MYSVIHIMAHFDLVSFYMVNKSINRCMYYLQYDRLGEMALELVSKRVNYV